jgi:methylated-DNA-[protein]-cysteine S-methyltransferase
LVTVADNLSAGWRHAHNDGMSSESPFAAILPTPFGALGVRVSADHLLALEFLAPGRTLMAPTSAFLERVAAELAAYYADPCHRFRLPLAPVGTAFRLRVWDALQGIPAGHSVTYGELAHRLGSSARAVGQALGDNPLPIVIPCHRVVAADGGLGGFNHSHSGYSLDIKRWLLAHEGVL